MRKVFKIDKLLLLLLFIFACISIITIYSAQNILPSYMNYLAYKQALWYVIGFIIMFIIIYLGNDFIIKNAWILYIFGILSLGALLIFGTPINDAKCWFNIPGIGTIQPSEFMKIILIIILARVINDFNTKYPNPTVLQEFLFLVKVMVIVLIPSGLTFLEPDTGVVLIYLLITLIMLFIAGIRYRWFFILFVILAIILGTILGIYFFNQDLFIKIFGSSFFLRIDRLLDWSNKSGFQLENGLTAISSGGLFGYGFNNTPIYFPEPQTDFIFAVYASNFGFIGSLILLSLILLFDLRIIGNANKNKNKINKYISAGILGMLIYQQLQNIGMTFGLMPITGITLPFISYGGSSLLSYMIMMGIVLNISKENKTYTNE